MPPAIVTGAVVGLIGGFSLGLGAPGVVAGVVCGALVGGWWQLVAAPMRAREAWRQEVSIAIIRLCAKMAKADGMVSSDEIRTFRIMVHIPARDEELVGALFNAARIQVEGYEHDAQLLTLLCRDRPDMLERALLALYAIALTDRPYRSLTTGQMVMLNHIGALFGFSGEALRAFERAHDLPHYRPEHAKAGATQGSHTGQRTQGPAPAADVWRNACAMLHVAEDANAETISKAYRKLIRTHHPDRIRGNGGSDAEVRAAEEKMAEITAAYGVLTKP